MNIFKYWKHKNIIAKQKEIIAKQEELISKQRDMIDFLLKEISRRDQKIIEQQKRMRFFGIEIGNEEYHAEKLDFPSTIKL